jgi:hypothetical protein
MKKLVSIWALSIVSAYLAAGAPMIYTVTFGAGGTTGFTAGGTSVGPVDLTFLGATGLNLSADPFSTVNTASLWTITVGVGTGSGLLKGDGYGVNNGGSGSSPGIGGEDNGYIDASGRPGSAIDALNLTFTSAVKLLSVTFDRGVAASDHGSAGTYLGTPFSGTLFNTFALGSGAGQITNIFAVGPTGTAFYFGATANGPQHQFLLRSVSFEFDANPGNGSQISEPATFGLVGAALVGVYLLGRRVARA